MNEKPKNQELPLKSDWNILKSDWYILWAEKVLKEQQEKEQPKDFTSEAIQRMYE